MRDASNGRNLWDAQEVWDVLNERDTQDVLTVLNTRDVLNRRNLWNARKVRKEGMKILREAEFRM